MKPEDAGEGSETDGDGSCREEDDERERGEDTVGNEVFPRVGFAGGDGCDARVCSAVVGKRIAVGE